jgi:hypothetical protein
MRNPSSFHVRKPVVDEVVGEPENRSESESPKCLNGAIVYVWLLDFIVNNSQQCGWALGIMDVYVYYF